MTFVCFGVIMQNPCSNMQKDEQKTCLCTTTVVNKTINTARTKACIISPPVHATKRWDPLLSEPDLHYWLRIQEVTAPRMISWWFEHAGRMQTHDQYVFKQKKSENELHFNLHNNVLLSFLRRIMFYKSTLLFDRRRYIEKNGAFANLTSHGENLKLKVMATIYEMYGLLKSCADEYGQCLRC